MIHQPYFKEAFHGEASEWHNVKEKQYFGGVFSIGV